MCFHLKQWRSTSHGDEFSMFWRVCGPILFSESVLDNKTKHGINFNITGRFVFVPLNCKSFYESKYIVFNSVKAQLFGLGYCITCSPVHSFIGQNTCVFSGLVSHNKRQNPNCSCLILFAKPCWSISTSPYEPMLNCPDEDIGDKSGSLPVWMTTFPCFLSGKIGFWILINHRASLKWNTTERNAHQGVWQNTICFLVIGKQDLGGIIYRDVIKHPVVRLTDWKHITRSDRAGENVRL